MKSERSVFPSLFWRLARLCARLPRLRCGGRLLFGLLTLAGMGIEMEIPVPAKAIDLDARIGFGQGTAGASKYRPETWTPLAVYLTGPGMSGTGQLQVAVHIADRTLLYARRITLHEGEMNSVETFALALRNSDPYRIGRYSVPEIEIQLLVDGRRVAGKKVPLPTPVNSSAFNVLALTRDGSGLSLLTKKQLGLFHRDYNANSDPGSYSNTILYRAVPGNNTIDPNAELSVLYPDPRALPASAQGYAMLDAMVLADLPLDSLTDDQLDAIRGYVRDGGLLIISGGSDLPRLQNRFLADLLPVTVQGVRALHSGMSPETAALAARYGGRTAAFAQMTFATGIAKPGARTLFGKTPGNTGYGVVCTRPYGAGTVTFVAFDVLDPAARAWTGAPAFWRDLLRTGERALSPRALLANHLQETSLEGTQRLADALAGRQATAAPPWQGIGAFLGAYLLLLVPISYFILKKLDRRELAWVTAPVIICGFTVGAYVLARSIKGGLLTVNRAVVLETNAGSDQAAAYGVFSLYSPQRANYDIALTGNELGPLPNNPTESQKQPADNAPASFRNSVPEETLLSAADTLGGTLTLETEPEGPTLRDTLIRLWDKRSFDVSFPVALGGSLDVITTSADGHHAQVRVTNRMRYTLHDCALLSNGGQESLGDLAPGQTKELSFLWNELGQTNAIPLHFLESRQNGHTHEETPEAARQTPEQTRTQIADALAQTLSTRLGPNNAYAVPSSVSGRSVTALAGWFHDPMLKVKVNGQVPAGAEATLLMAHLPMPAEAPADTQSSANPFLGVAAAGAEVTPGHRPGGVFK